MDWSRFTFEKGDHVLAMPCLEVVAFAYGAPASGAGFERFLRAFTEAFSDHLRFYRTGDMKRSRTFDAGVLDGPHHWFSDPRLFATKMLGFLAHSGESARNIRPPAVKISLLGVFKPPCFVVRMMLPVEWGSEPEEVMGLVQNALAEFPFKGGHCGYSLVWEETDISLEREVCAWAAPLLRRHPGLGYGDAITLSNAADRGLVAVNWLTFLEAEMAEILGGQAALAHRAPADVSVLPLGKGGVMLRAGDAPQLGDVNRQNLLPAYHAAGQLVAPVTAPDEALDDLAINGMSEEDAHDWLRRFFV
ncbi:type VI immunity family protein [Variovorax sp. AFSI2.2]|uniref:type VI immunity family protein n=1 Tax=Variovorax sp. AFSI2.2 TaxID=3384160 RepID=UPI003EBC4B4C